MSPKRIIAALACSLVPATTLQAAEWRPLPFESSYVVRSSGLEIGKLEQHLRAADGTAFTLHTETFPTGIAAVIVKERTAEESVFLYKNTRVIPLEYRFSRSGGTNAKAQKIVFDRSAWKVIGRTNSNDWQLAWQPRALFDNNSYQIGLLRDVAAGKADLTYSLVDNAELKTYHFQRQGEERVKTPLGEFQAVKIVRTQMPDKRATTIWSAPQLNFLPVRIDNTDRHGRLATALLQRVTGIPTATAAN